MCPGGVIAFVDIEAVCGSESGCAHELSGWYCRRPMCPAIMASPPAAQPCPWLKIRVRSDVWRPRCRCSGIISQQMLLATIDQQISAHISRGSVATDSHQTSTCGNRFVSRAAVIIASPQEARQCIAPCVCYRDHAGFYTGLHDRVGRLPVSLQ